MPSKRKNNNSENKQRKGRELIRISSTSPTEEVYEYKKLIIHKNEVYSFTQLYYTPPVHTERERD